MDETDEIQLLKDLSNNAHRYRDLEIGKLLKRAHEALSHKYLKQDQNQFIAGMRLGAMILEVEAEVKDSLANDS